MTISRRGLPGDFLFGAATSAYQIEGHAFGGAGPTHWDSFAAIPGKVARGETGAVACDHYHRWAEDLDLAAAAHLDIYRFSASWARVMPDGCGAVNAQGLDFYDRLVDGMLERGLKPALTLYHWEMPQALADLGGWTNPQIVGWFCDYAETLLARIGDRVWSTAPINEPWCIVWLGHFFGVHAPGLQDPGATARALHHVLLAHGRATAMMRARGFGNLGAVFNLEYSQPADDSPAAAAAARRHDAIYNRCFLEAVFRKSYPDELVSALGPHLPHGWQADFDDIAAPVDWVGINYYTRKVLAPSGGPWPSYAEIDGDLEKTGIGWEIYPEGLGRFLRLVAADYTGALPLYVTENGMAGYDRLQGGTCDDAARIRYLARHLDALRGAVADGVPVAGYVFWSLLDNYEWSLGYDARFGLVHVDFETGKRTPKASWHAVRQALAPGGS